MLGERAMQNLQDTSIGLLAGGFIAEAATLFVENWGYEDTPPAFYSWAEWGEAGIMSIGLACAVAYGVMRKRDNQSSS
jgi:hypothetical protein